MQTSVSPARGSPGRAASSQVHSLPTSTVESFSTESVLTRPDEYSNSTSSLEGTASRRGGSSFVVQLICEVAELRFFRGEFYPQDAPPSAVDQQAGGERFVRFNRDII